MASTTSATLLLSRSALRGPAKVLASGSSRHMGHSWTKEPVAKYYPGYKPDSIGWSPELLKVMGEAEQERIRLGTNNKPLRTGPLTPKNPITSAHLVDLSSGALSEADCVSYADGIANHGTYGSLPPAPSVPLEYLALLGPAAAGASVVRRSSGSIAVYGATRPEGLAVVQLAVAAGRNVASVIDGEHVGQEGLLDLMRCSAPWPSTTAPEQYAYVKKLFYDQCIKYPGVQVETAVIVRTDNLAEAAAAVEAARPGGMRAMAEAIYTLKEACRSAYGAARAVAETATRNGGKVVVLGGSVPGFPDAEAPEMEDAITALHAMEVPEGGDGDDAKLNFWVSRFNAADQEGYVDYAVHKASEPHQGPRYIVVTK
eukprot:CAMPEP_0194279540 /NCGR_PEP_ID=MMETSP0169-20130528/13985_1 /TAXON_ID=218684 /ORGANISM="Corethron pennatum, Strain L29A3" /LENGTH=370 /DNA_ID=CAMNT_0039023975 /DNA_START=65 /DNA_END=1177 /DNA_ORIENTATION=-